MKKVQILIISLVIILVLGCTTFAFLYFATDFLKSDKEMFYKYASKINVKEFIDLENYNTYSKRLQTEGYENEGEFSIEIEQEEQVISESIEYNGYTDPINKIANYDISINKDNQTLLELNYLNNQDLYGVLFKDVVNQYLVFENNNLKEFVSKFGEIDTSSIPDKIQIPDENINNKELNLILNKYLNIAIETIPEDNYSKIKTTEISLGNERVQANGYQVKLKVKDVQKIFTKVLEKAKEDEQLFNLFKSEDISFEDYQTGMDRLIVLFSEEIPSEENTDYIKICVYKKGKDTVRLSMIVTEEEERPSMEVSIDKTDEGIMLKCSIIYYSYDETEDDIANIVISKTANSEEQEKFECVASKKTDEGQEEVFRINMLRNGALESYNVTFDLTMYSNISVPFNMSTENITLKVGIKNTSNFSGDPLEAEFAEGNYLAINDLQAEQISNLFVNLGNILGEKLKDEMFVSMIVGYNGLFEKAEQAAQSSKSELIEEENMLSNLNRQVVQTFNSQFAVYEGTRNGAEIRNLNSLIRASNGINPEHIVIYSGVLQEEIESSKTYDVSFQKDEEGYINQVIVKEN